MMRCVKKAVTLALSLLMVISMLSVGFTVSAASLTEGDVQSLTVSPIHITDGTNGGMCAAYNDDTQDYDLEYYSYYWWDLMSYTVMLSDGTTIVGEGTGFEHDGEWYSLEYGDYQSYETAWTVGNTYTETVSLLGVEASVSVTIDPSPIDSITVEPITLIEGTNGYTTTDYNFETDAWDLEYYCYSWSNCLQYAITMTDGSVLTGNGTGVNVNGEDVWFSYNDGQSYEEYWTAGNTYNVKLMLMGVSTTVDITITASPVEEIVLEPITLLENTDGSVEWEYNEETGENDLEYYHYRWADRLTYTVRFTDGTSVSGNGTGVDYNGQYYGFEYTDGQSYQNAWTVGNTYTETVTFMGRSAAVSVTVDETPIESITIDPITMTEGVGGWTNTAFNEATGEWDLEYYYYPWYNKLSYSVTFRDGTVAQGNGTSLEYDGQSYSFEWTDAQSYDAAWTAGNAYTGTVSMMGVSADVSVTIAASPVSSIVFEPVTLIEGMNGYLADAYNEETGEWDRQYYRYWWTERLSYTVSFTDGSSVTGTGSGFWYQDEWCSFTYVDPQSYDTAWTAGNTYTVPVTAMGVRAEATVTIEYSPVASIAFEPLSFAENTNGYYEYVYSEETGTWMPQFFKYNWWYAVEYAVTMTDGSVVTGTGTSFSYNGVNYSFTYTDEQQYENRWLPGNTYQVDLSLMGQSASLYVSICSLEQQDGFSYIVQNGEAIITGCEKIVKKLVIPETLGGYTVVGVTDISDALPYATELVISDTVTKLSSDVLHSFDPLPLRTLTLGSGVTALSVNMLTSVPQLAAIHVSQDNAVYCSVDGVVYDKAVTQLVLYPPAKTKTVTLPNTVTDVDMLFENMNIYAGVSVEIPADSTSYKQVDGVVYNSDMTVIYACDAQKTGTYVMPDSVQQIADCAFMNSSLSDVVISDNVTDIVYYAFCGSNNLKSVTLPDTLVSISDGAFRNCPNLTAITLPEGLEVLEENAFRYSGVTSVSIPGSVAVIGESAFDSSALQSVTIGEGVGTISYGAFASTPLKAVSIPDSVDTMGGHAFANCTALENLTFGEGLRYIPRYAFINAGVTAVTLPQNIEQVDESAFYNAKLKEVIFENDAVAICSSAFDGCPLETLDLGEKVTYIGEYAFRGSALESLTLPDSVTDITYRSFADSTKLAQIDISDNLESLCGYAFDNTVWYDSQPEGVVYLENALYGYKGLMPADTEIVVEDGTTVIADYAFEKQGGLKTLTLPATLRTIGDYAFYDCLNLEAIYVDEANPYFTSEEGVLYDQYGDVVWERTLSEIVSMSFTYGGKTELAYGEALPYAWQSLIYVTYADGSQTYVHVHEGLMIGGYDPYKVGVQTLTVTYGDFTDTFEVTVLESEVTAIYIESQPTTLVYELRQTLNTDGMVVMARLADGSTVEVIDYTVSGYDATVSGVQTVTVEYKGKTATFDVAVDDTLIRFSAPEESIDISVPVGVIDEDAQLVVEAVASEEVTQLAPEVFEGKTAAVYDIFFQKNEEEIQPSGAVTVSIPVAQTMDADTCLVYHVGDDKVMTPVDAEYMDGCMVFEATSFSYYILVAEERTLLCGDLNADGAIALEDALTLFCYVNGTADLTDGQTTLADVNGDGRVTLSDAVRLFYYVSGHLAEL